MTIDLKSKDPATLAYRLGGSLGYGGFSMVFKATELNTGRELAVKQSRAPLKVKRTLLRHESRILQLLRGHPAIPEVYGYGHLLHFEFLAMEKLGQSVRDKWPGSSLRIPVNTAVSFIQQALSALEHVNKLGFIHRDIKPENFLCSLDDPSNIKLIDFNISQPIKIGPPNSNDPISESKNIVGTLHWASLNAMHGVDIAPRDDLESLSYTGIFLVRSDLPWRNISVLESEKRGILRIRDLKARWTGGKLGAGSPPEFGGLLDYSRGLGFGQIPDYEIWQARFADLARRLGVVSGEPLDWTPEELPAMILQTDTPSDGPDTDPALDIEEDTEADNQGEELKALSCSYFGYDIDRWDFIQDERDLDLTMPLEQQNTADSQIPTIVEVFTRFGDYK